MQESVSKTVLKKAADCTSEELYQLSDAVVQAVQYMRISPNAQKIRIQHLMALANLLDHIGSFRFGMKWHNISPQRKIDASRMKQLAPPTRDQSLASLTVRAEPITKPLLKLFRPPS